MRILVEPSDYVLLNAGDMAMQHACISRLHAAWPDAEIRVFAEKPEDLGRFCPAATAFPTSGRRAWLSGRFLDNRLVRRLPARVGSLRSGLEDGIRRRWPGLATAAMRRKLRRWGASTGDLDSFVEAVAGADLLVHSGGGGITDAFPEYAFDVLDTLGLAIRSGVTTAMVGQGIGPIEDPRLRKRAGEILPKVDFIGLREDRAGGPLLRSLGVDPGRVMTTGDDAIEMAFGQRPDRLGDGIGVNLRASSYSEVGRDLVERVGTVLRRAALDLHAPLVPVPISRVPGEADAQTIALLLGEMDDGTGGGAAIDSPVGVLGQVRRCRLVVTGSYHAAVFALSMGVPAVGLAKSAYYVDKFEGLAGQFGAGCAVVSLTDRDSDEKLTAAIGRAWATAEETRPALLDAASRQIELGLEAYGRIAELATSRRSGRPPRRGPSPRGAARESPAASG